VHKRDTPRRLRFVNNKRHSRLCPALRTYRCRQEHRSDEEEANRSL
jgi:hypothetical protein